MYPEWLHILYAYIEVEAYGALLMYTSDYILYMQKNPSEML